MVPRIIEKAWGTAAVLHEEIGKTVVHLYMKPGGYTSLHSHKFHRHCLQVVSGTLFIIGEDGTVTSDGVMEVHPFHNHRLYSPRGCDVIETYYGHRADILALNDIDRVDTGGILDL